MGFLSQLSNGWHIFKLSLSFIKKDKSLLIVPVIISMSLIIFLIGFFFSLPFFANYFHVSADPKAFGNAYFVAYYAIFLFVVVIWSTFLGAAQSWMVHEVAQGKNTTFSSGLERAIKNILDILLFSLISLIIGLILGVLKKKTTSLGGKGAIGFLGFVGGVAGKLVLPAMIVTEKNFVDSVKQLKESIKIVPEIGVFEAGFRAFIFLFSFIAIFAALLVAKLFGFVVGASLFAIVFVLITAFATLINQIYYTLLYLVLIEKKKIEGLRLIP